MAMKFYGKVELDSVAEKSTSGDVLVLDGDEVKYRTPANLKTDLGVPSVIRASGVSVTWASDTSVSGYSYKGTIALSGCTTSHVPIVTFTAIQAASGSYCPYAESGTNCVYIWSTTNTSITVDVVAVM